MKRYESLDWLRGILAFIIMIYHYTNWEYGSANSIGFLSILGIYGVSIFFALSGLSMALVYNNHMNSINASLKFYVRRLFRLLPLLWIGIFVVSWLHFNDFGYVDYQKIFLNLTLLFGFISPDSYINVGAWSIGNECVYYAITPIIFILFNRSIHLGNLAVLFSVLIGVWFGFNLLDSNQALSEQWAIYINPFNNIMFYMLGVGLYFNFHHKTLPSIAKYLILIPLLIFVFYPTNGNQISIVTGYQRFIFVGCAIMITLGAYKLNLTCNLNSFVSKSLTHLGEITYGIYLLHPILYVLSKRLYSTSSEFTIITNVCLTIIAAHLVYRFYEKPFILLGKRLTDSAS